LFEEEAWMNLPRFVGWYDSVSVFKRREEPIAASQPPSNGPPISLGAT
jgi:hypothetical protein